MDLSEVLLKFGLFRWLSQNLTGSCIVLGFCILAMCVSYGYIQLLTIDDLEEHRKKERKSKVKNKNETDEAAFERAIMSILDTSDTKTKNQLKLNELTKRRLPITVRFKQFLNGMVHNPYNTTSIPKILMISFACAGVGMCLGLLLANPAALIVFSVMGFAVPIIMVSLQILKKQLSVMEGNLGLMSNHLGVYKESSSLIESFKTLLTVLTPGTREFKAINTAVVARTEAKITMEIVLRELMEALLADINVRQYFEVCYIADTVSADYKEALDYLPSRFHPIVIKNITFVSMCFYAYILYIGISIGVIGMMLYYRFCDAEIYTFLTDTNFGRIGSLILMGMLLALGFMIARVAKVIHLDIAMEGGRE